MSLNRGSVDPAIQPAGFAFTDENLAMAEKIIARYPKGRQASAVMPLLELAQVQNDNWLSRTAMDHVADMLGMQRTRVYEVATFYTMYNLRPVGRFFVQVCTTTPCWLRGSDGLMDVCRRKLGAPNTVTEDGNFSYTEVECLGACVNAPMAQINSNYYEDLTPERFEEILDMLARGEEPPIGTQGERFTSSPAGGLTTLKDQARSAAVETEEV